MDFIFEIKDIFGKRIHLSKERWTHINQEHPELSSYFEELKDALTIPTKIVPFDDEIHYYYKYLKYKDGAKYLLVVVKYLNEHGFIITAYFVRNIK